MFLKPIRREDFPEKMLQEQSVLVIASQLVFSQVCFMLDLIGILVDVRLKNPHFSKPLVVFVFSCWLKWETLKDHIAT